MRREQKLNTFHLQIVTPSGLVFDDNAGAVTVRTAAGDIGILAGHADYVAPVINGTARVTYTNGDVKTALCDGGLVSVKHGVVRLVTEKFEWNGDTK